MYSKKKQPSWPEKLVYNGFRMKKMVGDDKSVSHIKFL